MTSGSRIVESSYDYDTFMIGPYQCYAEVHKSDKAINDHVTPHDLYAALLADDRNLAVFDDNGFAVCVMQHNAIDIVPLCSADYLANEDLYHHYDLQNVPAPIVYRHVGYERTELNCFTVLTPPYKLIEHPMSNIVMGYGQALPSEPVYDPPVDLYFELIKTNHRAVYLDKATNQPRFIDF